MDKRIIAALISSIALLSGCAADEDGEDHQFERPLWDVDLVEPFRITFGHAPRSF